MIYVVNQRCCQQMNLLKMELGPLSKFKNVFPVVSLWDTLQNYRSSCIPTWRMDCPPPRSELPLRDSHGKRAKLTHFFGSLWNFGWRRKLLAPGEPLASSTVGEFSSVGLKVSNSSSAEPLQGWKTPKSCESSTGCIKDSLKSSLAEAMNLRFRCEDMDPTGCK